MAQNIVLHDNNVYLGDQVFYWGNDNGDFAVFWTPWGTDSVGRNIFKYLVAYSIPRLGRPSHKIENTINDLHILIREIESWLMAGEGADRERHFPFSPGQMQDEIELRIHDRLWIKPMKIPPCYEKDPVVVNKIVVV